MYTGRMDSDIFFGEILCAYIYQLNHSLPFELDLVLRVLAKNSIGSTSSKLLRLTVEIIASNDNQSAFEVRMHSSSPSVIPTSSSKLVDL